MPDIDIDFVDRDQALTYIKHISASRFEDNKLVKHNTGIYLHPVPVNAESGLCSIPYNEAEHLDYFKIDFLNFNVYKDIKNEEHLSKLMNNEPLWDLLEQREFVDLLVHINGHNDILKKMKPKNIEELAAVLAMIRPAKRYLVGKDWKTIFNEIWEKPDNGDYYFKKSHAIAYAMVIMVQMNLICESISYDYS
jgi:DNA polymerase III alpha subunit